MPACPHKQIKSTDIISWYHRFTPPENKNVGDTVTAEKKTGQNLENNKNNFLQFSSTLKIQTYVSANVFHVHIAWRGTSQP